MLKQDQDEKPRKVIQPYTREAAPVAISEEAQEIRDTIERWYLANKTDLNAIPPLAPTVIVERIKKLFV